MHKVKQTFTYVYLQTISFRLKCAEILKHHFLRKIVDLRREVCEECQLNTSGRDGKGEVWRKRLPVAGKQQSFPPWPTELYVDRQSGQGAEPTEPGIG